MRTHLLTWNAALLRHSFGAFAVAARDVSGRVLHAIVVFISLVSATAKGKFPRDIWLPAFTCHDGTSGLGYWLGKK